MLAPSFENKILQNFVNHLSTNRGYKYVLVLNICEHAVCIFWYALIKAC